MPSPLEKTWLKASLLGAVAVSTVYLVTALEMPAPVQTLSRAAGVWLAVLVVFGRRYWPTVTIAALLLASWQTLSPYAAVFVAFVATTQALLGAWLLARFRFDPSLNHLRHVFLLAFAALGPPLLGVGARVLGQWAGWNLPGLTDEWANWRSDMLSVLFIAPIIFAWRSLPRLRLDAWKKGLEAVALFGSLGVGCWLVFASTPPGASRGFLLIPIGLWAAMRFGLRTMATVNLVVAVSAFIGTVRGLGQLGLGSLQERMILLTGMLFVAALMNLIFYAAFSERTEARDTRERLAQILESTTDFVGTADLSGRATFLNAAGRKMVGMEPDEDITQRNVTDFHPPLAANAITQEAIPAAMTSGFWRGETALRSKDGGEVPVSQVVLSHQQDGKIEFISTIARDISVEKRAERELRLSEERFSKAFRATPDGIAITTLHDGKYVEVNDAFLIATGYSREEVIGRTTLDLNIWQDRQERTQLLEALRATGRVSGVEARFNTRTGRTIIGIVSAEVVDVGGEPCLLSVIRDVTRPRQMEDQLRQSQKMEAVGRLAAGIAHDFNNLLLVIHGYSELQLDSLSADDPARKGVEEVKNAADRAAALTRQLLAFSRKQVLEPKVLDLNLILADVSTLLRRLIGANVELYTILDPALGRMKADPSQIEQILINLAVNARDAMPDGGRITVETANVELDASFAETRPEVVPGKYVMMAVSDTGVGMDGVTQSKIFEPFFTTKDREKGTGLGLATVYGIVKQSSGYIYVYSEPGRGTTFKVFLPQAAEPLSAAVGQAVAGDTRGDENILLVEDEEAVRNLARDFLGLKGYRVTAVASGTDALKLMEENPGEIDLLLTDMVMPGVGGRKLADTLRQKWPHLRVLFISGYTDDAVLRAGTLREDEDFLQKPFALTTLAARVRAALSKPAAHAFENES